MGLSFNKCLGDRLKQLRKQFEWQQEDIAIRLDLNRVSYAHYELGKNIPPSDKLAKLADIFDVSTDFLLGRTSEPKGIYNVKTPDEIVENLDTLRELTQ